jgi:hypothetical protein
MEAMMRTQFHWLLVAAAAGVTAWLPATASAQMYRGFSRPGGYVPGNYGMTRPTGYAPSNYGMMRSSGYTPSNFGNPSANFSAYNYNWGAATPGTAVPIGAVTTLPGTPIGPYLTPWAVSAVPPVNPPPSLFPQGTPPFGTPIQNVPESFASPNFNQPPTTPEQATPPVPGTPPAAGEQGIPPGGTPAAATPNAPAAVAPNAAAVAPSLNAFTTGSNPFAPGTTTPQSAASPLAPRSFNSVYSSPQYQPSFYAPLARVYGYRNY